MTMLAIEECDDRDLLPEKYRNLLDNKVWTADDSGGRFILLYIVPHLL